MSILLGYGVKFKLIEEFNWFSIMNLFDLAEKYPEIMSGSMTNEYIYDTLVFNEGVTVGKILKALSNESNILTCVFTGKENALVYAPKISWFVTDKEQNLREKDILDEISYIVSNYYKYIIEPSEISYIYSEE